MARQNKTYRWYRRNMGQGIDWVTPHFQRKFHPPLIRKISQRGEIHYV